MSIYVERSTGKHYHLMMYASPLPPRKNHIVIIQPVDGYYNWWLEADTFKRDFYVLDEPNKIKGSGS